MLITSLLYAEDLTSHPNHLKLHCYFLADHSNHCFAILFFFVILAFFFFLSLFINVAGIFFYMKLYDFLLLIFSQRPTNSCFFDLDSQFDRLKYYISVNAIHEPLMILLNKFLCFLHYILMVLSQNF